jgi:hypothetical protein
MQDMYYLQCTVVINLRHPFLVKWLREEKDRDTVPLDFLPKNKRISALFNHTCTVRTRNHHSSLFLHCSHGGLSLCTDLRHCTVELLRVEAGENGIGDGSGRGGYNGCKI